MIDIDWGEFSAKVPEGAVVRCHDDFTGGFVEGVLLENYPHTMRERMDTDVPQEIIDRYKDVLRFQENSGWKAEENLESSVPAQMLEYFIGGQWRTFAQIMGEG